MDLTHNQAEILSRLSLQYNRVSDCHDDASVSIVHDMKFQHSAFIKSEYKLKESIKHLTNHNLDTCDCMRKVRFMADIDNNVSGRII